MNELIFKMTWGELFSFLEMVKELVKVHEDFKLIFLKKGILLYTIKYEGKSTKINVFKSFTIKWGDNFKQFPSDLFLNATFMEGKAFHDKMNYLLDSKDDDYDIAITYDKNNVVYSFGGKNSVLNVRAICQNTNKIKDMTFEMIDDKMDAGNAEWSFEMTNEQLAKVISLSKLEKTNECLTVRVDSGDIIFCESQWDLKIGTTDAVKSGSWDFKKENLKFVVNDPKKTSFVFSIFDTFILINESKSLLMFSMELIDLH